MTYDPILVLALLTLVIGWRLIKVAINLLDRAMDRQNVDLTLQGSLSNFADSMVILLFKPFAIGDLIEAQGH